ncbi:MAG: 4Fe-4S binding protein [Thermacetogeniaceae bacterium]
MVMRSGIKRRPLALWRTLIPAISSGLTISLMARLHYPLPHDAIALLWLSRLDPLLLASALRWDGALPYWAWLPLAGLLVAAAIGRLFCGWLCPVGGLLSLLQSGREFLDGTRSGICKYCPRARGDISGWHFFWECCSWAVTGRSC